ncbi:MAG: hypothetical protein AAF244_02815 [Pseudomonadota bacterium]
MSVDNPEQEDMFSAEAFGMTEAEFEELRTIFLNTSDADLEQMILNSDQIIDVGAGSTEHFAHESGLPEFLEQKR